MNNFVIRYKLCHPYFMPEGWSREAETNLHKLTKHDTNLFNKMNHTLYEFREVMEEDKNLVYIPHGCFWQEYLRREDV